ncbi:MAG: Rrf2 family transcriptional regulator [Acidobacteria bacterium]|nr:Rrf2 family transcriptional regulator [Acidobacteriota bacterium]MCB9397923.1 Rrf2 family transcriptional regulator [Acidobacteriota bacterium]
MLFTPTCEYAIRALIFLAGHPAEKPITVQTIGQATDIPTPFLSKILLNLKNHGFLKSTKGPGGGYYLSRSANDIILEEIVQACDGPKEHGEDCVLGLDQCSDKAPCPLHHEWKRFKAEIDLKIHRLTIKDLHQKLVEKQSVLKV